MLKASAATGAGAAGLFAAGSAGAGGDRHERWADEDPPRGSGRWGRRIIIRGGAVMSMDPEVGDFPTGDVLIEGKRTVAVGPDLDAGGATEIDARGRIVMPGFIDTHHHQFETALRSFLADEAETADGGGGPLLLRDVAGEPGWSVRSAS